MKILLVPLTMVILFFIGRLFLSTSELDEKIIIKKENLPPPWDSEIHNSELFPLFASNIIKVDEGIGSGIRKYPSEDTIKYFLQKIREANFTNLVVNLSPAEKHLQIDEYYNNFFSTLNKVNSGKNTIPLRALIYDKRLFEDEIEELIPLLKRIYSSRDILGFYIDEPSPQEFVRIGKLSDEFNTSQKSNPLFEKLLYVNLFGVSSIENYESYLKNWIAIGKPRLLSFDNYAVWNDDQAKKYGHQIGFDWGTDYFLNLELFRNYSFIYNIPFWNWISVHKHFSHYSKRYYRRSTASEISFQIYSAMMYGSKGILYYNFWNPDKRLNKNGWNEDEAILNTDGTETELFEKVKRINHKAQSIGSVLMKMKNVGVYHSSNKNILRKESGDIEIKTEEGLFEKPSADFRKKYGIRLIDWNETDKLPDEDLENKIISSMDNPFAAVGIFKADKNFYILVINKNRKGEEEIRIEFNESKINFLDEFVNSIEPNIKIHLSRSSEGKLSIATRIAAGDASLFRLNNK